MRSSVSSASGGPLIPFFLIRAAAMSASPVPSGTMMMTYFADVDFAAAALAGLVTGLFETANALDKNESRARSATAVVLIMWCSLREQYKPRRQQKSEA